MIFIGIDISKDKHDCFIVNSEGVVLFEVFTISNARNGFNDPLPKIKSVSTDFSKTKVGLEAIGHYSYSLIDFYLTIVFPPMS